MMIVQNIWFKDTVLSADCRTPSAHSLNSLLNRNFLCSCSSLCHQCLNRLLKTMRKQTAACLKLGVFFKWSQCFVLCSVCLWFYKLFLFRQLLQRNWVVPQGRFVHKDKRRTHTGILSADLHMMKVFRTLLTRWPLTKQTESSCRGSLSKCLKNVEMLGDLRFVTYSYFTVLQYKVMMHRCLVGNPRVQF